MDRKKPVIFQFSIGDDLMQNIAKERNTNPKIQGAGSNGTTIREAWTRDEALRLMENEGDPHAIIVTDPAITWEENAILSSSIVQYVREGGTCILTLTFPSMVRFDDFDRYMKQDWGLPWKHHSYTRDTHVINPSALGRRGPDLWLHGLQTSYECKSLYIDGVTPEATWYKYAAYPPGYEPEDVDEMEDVQRANAQTHTPVAFTRVGKGYLGYTGDVNQEDSTDAIVLAMLGLGYPVKWCSCGHQKFSH